MSKKAIIPCKRGLIAFFLIIIITVTSVGCGQKKTLSPEENKKNNTIASNEVQNDYPLSTDEYMAEALSLNENSYIEANAFQNDCLYYVVTTIDENGSSVRTMRNLILDTLSTNTFIEKIEVDEEFYVRNIFFDVDGNLFIYLTQYQNINQTNVNTDCILTYKKDGTFIDRISVNAIPVDQNNSIYLYNQMCCDSYGNFYIPTTERNIYVLKSDGSFFFSVTVPGNVSGLCETSDGKVMVSYNLPGNQESAAAFFDPQNKSLGSPLESFPLTAESGVLFSGHNEIVLVNELFNLMLYNTTTKEYLILKPWRTSGVDQANIEAMYENKNGDIFILTSDLMSNTSTGRRLYCLRKYNSGEVPDKIKLTIGAMCVDQNFSRIISAYNLSNSKYEFEIKYYQSGSRYFGDDEIRTAITNLNAELASGIYPDILNLNYMGHFADSYIDKGVLIDIAPYLEADNTVSEDDLLPNILDIYRRNEALYAIIPTFNLFPWVGLKSVIGEGELTRERIQNALKNHPEITEIIDNSTKLTVLVMLFGNDFESYVNYDNATCYFDSPEFRSIMELSNACKRVEYDYDNYSFFNWDKIAKHEQLLTSPFILSIDNILIYDGLTDGDTIFHGNPTKQGEVIMTNPSTPALAITSKCQYPEAAWSLISFMLSMENQCNALNSGLPISKKALSALIEEASICEYDSDGILQPYKNMSIDGNPFEIFPVTSEQEQLIWDLVSMPVVLDTYDIDICPIIYEEAEYYFRGERGLDETCNIIQSRIKLYLSENY